MNVNGNCGSDGFYGTGGEGEECYLSHHDMLHEVGKEELSRIVESSQPKLSL